MIQLLQHYTLPDIIIFTVFLALAVKSLFSFFDWVQQRIKKSFNKEHNKLNNKDQLQRRLQHGSQLMAKLQTNQESTDSVLKDLNEKINVLIESDKDNIKYQITKAHHNYCYQKKLIDDFSLNCLEKLYQHYEQQGGNSFIKSFMSDLRALPRQ